MARTNRSARQAGSRFERLVADYLRDTIDDRIDRRVKTGAKDRGDIAGLRAHGQRIVVEVKDCTRTQLGPWLAEAETERGNDDALAGIVISKRHGKGTPEHQIVHMTLQNFVSLITGQPTKDNK